MSRTATETTPLLSPSAPSPEMARGKDAGADLRQAGVVPVLSAVPTPSRKPAGIRRAAIGREADRVLPRKRLAERKRAMRIVRVADEDSGDGRPRRFFTLPLPPIIGAYR